MPHPFHKNIRLPSYDYSASGAYFLTICAKDRRPIFGNIKEGKVIHSSIGSVVHETWLSLPSRFARVALDESIVMPDHFHGILWLHDPIASHSLSRVVCAFKSLSVFASRRADLERWSWQRGYYDRVVRSQQELDSLRSYIRENPLRTSLKQ